MHDVLVNRLGGLSLPRKSVVRLTDCPNMTLDVCRGRKTTTQQQRYESIAAHTRRHASVLVVFVVFCMHMHSFAALIRRTPPPTFSDTAITDRHSNTTIFQLRAHWVLWSIGLEKIIWTCPPVRVEPLTSCVQGKHPIH